MASELKLLSNCGCMEQEVHCAGAFPAMCGAALLSRLASPRDVAPVLEQPGCVAEVSPSPVPPQHPLHGAVDAAALPWPLA